MVKWRTQPLSVWRSSGNCRTARFWRRDSDSEDSGFLIFAFHLFFRSFTCAWLHMLGFCLFSKDFWSIKKTRIWSWICLDAFLVLLSLHCFWVCCRCPVVVADARWIFIGFDRYKLGSCRSNKLFRKHLRICQSNAFVPVNELETKAVEKQTACHRVCAPVALYSPSTEIRAQPENTRQRYTIFHKGHDTRPFPRFTAWWCASKFQDGNTAAHTKLMCPAQLARTRTVCLSIRSLCFCVVNLQVGFYLQDYVNFCCNWGKITETSVGTKRCLEISTRRSSDQTRKAVLAEDQNCQNFSISLPCCGKTFSATRFSLMKRAAMHW